MNKLFFVPVGTSLVSNYGYNSYYDENTVNGVVDQLLTNQHLSSESIPLENHPAEIASLFKFIKHPEWTSQFENAEIEVVLLPSPESKHCACGIKKLIQNNNYFPKPKNSQWTITIEEVNNLDPNDHSKFESAIEQVFQIIEGRLQTFDGEVFLNITGGYKGLLPYLTIHGMLRGKKVTVFYLFEKSQGVITLPTYPLAFDLMEWRDWRGLLLPFKLDLRLSEEQKKDLFKAMGDSKISRLIGEKTLSLNIVGKWMDALYSSQRGVELSEFGKGGLLLENFSKNSPFPKYLMECCIPRWRHLSAGDHIPETVEHGRGHVQRLLELTQQLLVATEGQITLTDDQLFVLISSIWLHDLGHSGDYFNFEGNDGVIKNKTNPSDTSSVPLYDDPGAIRKNHNILTYQLIKENREFLFPCLSSLQLQNSEQLLRSIELACLYHSREMPVNRGENKDFVGYTISKGIENFKEGEEVIQGFPFVAALLRFLDGAENQEERAGSDEYYEVMQWVLDRQIKFLDNYKSCGNKKAFKEKQKEHYLKHRSVRHVFLVKEKNDRVNKQGIYGCDDDQYPIIGAYMIVNKASKGFSIEEVVKKVFNAFLDEFLRVQKLLKFRLALFLIEQNGQSCVKKQVVVKKEKNKNYDDWEYCLCEFRGGVI